MRTSVDAVSDVIAAALMIALVVLGFTIVASFVFSSPLPEKVPKVQFSVRNQTGGFDDDDSGLILIHEGGESLAFESFQVVVNGVYYEPIITRPSGEPIGDWSLGTYVRPKFPPGYVLQSPYTVGLVYTGGTGDTLLRSAAAPGGFDVLFPSYDPTEVIDLPEPEPTTNYSAWDLSQPITWPADRASIAPFPDTVTFDPLKVAYVAAHDSTFVPPEPPLFVCDGVDDDRQINDALTMMRGGTVYLLDGSFHCSDRIRVPGTTRLAGKGSTLTKIEVLAKDGQSGYLPVTLNQPNVTIEGFSLYGNGFVMVTTSHVRVRDIAATSRELDHPEVMRRASGNGMFFVWATTEDLRDIEFYNCKAKECHTHGWNMNQDYSDRVERTIGWVRLVGCQAILCGYGEPAGSRSEWITGFDLHEWQDLRHVWVIDCLADNNWESGFHLEPGARYLEPPGPRTISEDINFLRCNSTGNGWRNTHSGAFFMSGFYLSRNTTLTNCNSTNNRNSGFYVHGGTNSSFDGCSDDGSTYGWKICKASSDITLENCRADNNDRWGFWASFSNNIQVLTFTQTNCTGFRGLLNNLGWYKDERKYQQPVTNSEFVMTYKGDSSLPIINREGSGNQYTCNFISA